MLILQDLMNDFKKFDYYISNSSGGFVVWECNEFLSKRLIADYLEQYSQVIYIDVLKSDRNAYLNLLKKNIMLDKKRIFVFNNFSENYSYDNYFDIDNLLNELNFTRDVWAKYEYIYVFILPTFLVDKIMKGSPSFWSYVSIHFRIPNIINNPLPFAKIKRRYMEQFYDQRFSVYCEENNDIVNLYKKVKNDHDKQCLLDKMISLYNSMTGECDKKVLRVVYFNLSRLFSLNNKFEEAFHYAVKSDKVYSSSKSRVNILYCELNVGYRKNQRKEIHYNNLKEWYFRAVEHFAYGNLEAAHDLVTKYIAYSGKKDKYTYLFYELLAVLHFAKKNYRTSFEILMEIRFGTGEFTDNIFFNADVIENNLKIVSQYLG